jgi:hypothetical protein
MKYYKNLKKNKFIFTVLLLILMGIVLTLGFFLKTNDKSLTINIQPLSQHTPTPTQTPLPPIPVSKTLSNGGYHIFQSFNNCGPASLSMALRFYGIDVSQTEIGNDLRPYQVPGGNNDDKSVTLEELAEKSKEYGFNPIHRPMGNPDIVKQFIANDMPVIARTWTKPSEDIGHYRVIKGYDDSRKILIQDDSLQDKNLEYTYSDFNEIWRKFNYEYLVLVPEEKKDLVNAILGDHADAKKAWLDAVENSEEELRLNPNDLTSRFNLSVALVNIGEYQRATEEFEKVESRLSFRTLWYQIEPIQAYYQLKNYERVFQISERILNNHNRAFSELYILKGKSYLEQGQTELARTEFEKAVLYNRNLEEANRLLESI